MNKQQALILGFVQIMEEEGNSSSIEAIRNLALAKLATGEVKTLVSSSVNSKSFSFQVSMPAEELFGAVSEAIRRFNSGVIGSTEIDFSGV
jgi:hypothetical protein